MAVFIGCGSKGAILYDQKPKSEIRGYIAETLQWVDTAGDSLEVVFHRAGSFQEYANEFALSNNQSGYAYNFIAGTNRGLIFDIQVLKD